MPPKEELFRPFENVVEVTPGRHQETLILTWRVFENRVYLRSDDQNNSFVFTVAPPDYVFVDSRQVEKSIHRWFRREFHWKAVQRVVTVPDDMELEQDAWIHLYWNGLVVLSLENWKRSVWRFLDVPLQETASWFHSPSTSIQQKLSRNFKTNRAEWEDARRWAGTSDEQRFWSLVSWERGSQNQWCQLVQTAFQLGLVQRQTKRDRISWAMFLLYKPRFPQAPLQIEKRSFWPSGSVWELLRLAQQHFGARVNYNWSRMPPHEALNPPRVQASRPSQHELMQALDLWRDFGRKSNQLPRVEELLRELLA